MDQPTLFAVMGPTACGKSELAERLAEHFDAVLVNADAFQVYRFMNIGTAKPENPDRYHLMNIKNPDEAFGVGEYVQLACRVLEECFIKRQNVVLVGGTGFYIRALLEQYDDLDAEPDPQLRKDLEERLEAEGLLALVKDLLKENPNAAQKIDLKNPVRVRRALEKALSKTPKIKVHLPPFRQIKTGIVPDTDLLSTKIQQRCRTMLQTGWISEVEELLKLGYHSKNPGFRAIGYELIEKFVLNGGSEEELESQISLETVQYAKRQRTWLRSEPRLTVFERNMDAYRHLTRGS